MRSLESKGLRPIAVSSWLMSLSGADASCATVRGSIAMRTSAKSSRRIGLHIFIDQDLRDEAASVTSFHLRRVVTWQVPAACQILASFPYAREAILIDNSPSLNYDPAVLPFSNCSR